MGMTPTKTCTHHWVIVDESAAAEERWRCRRCGAVQRRHRPLVRPRPAQRMAGATWSREELVIAGLLGDDD